VRRSRRAWLSPPRRDSAGFSFARAATRPEVLLAWRFDGVRTGWERVRLTTVGGTTRARGVSRGVDADEGVPWRIAYDLAWDHGWRFRSATVRSRDAVRRVERDDTSGWVVDGSPRPEFADCADLDLQVSLLTNAAPAHRFASRARPAAAPALYLTSTLEVERLDQTYRRLPGPGIRFDYDSPAHGYRAILRFAPDGFVIDYPFIGRRVGVAATSTARPPR
jgi:hypothetical protein